MDDEEQFMRLEHLRMESGMIIKIYPMLKISLGQLIVVVVRENVSAWRQRGMGWRRRIEKGSDKQWQRG